jgi:flavin reductase (DIM6/NTAB) family NADH-FMN oxidoreductase RutF
MVPQKPQPPSFESVVFREALGTFLTGVTVVTTIDETGRHWGLTANSFTSVSLEPPLVLFCVASHAGSYDTFSRCPSFVVNILSYDQLDLAHRFSRRSPDKFEGLHLDRSSAGSPVLPGSSAWLGCTVYQRLVVGDHLVVIGRVLEVETSGSLPLGYSKGNFLSLAPERQGAARSAPTGRVQWMIEADNGDLLLALEPSGGWALPTSPEAEVRLDDDWLVGAARRLSGADEIDAPALFAVYDDSSDGVVTLAYRCRARGAVGLPPAPLRFVDSRTALNETRGNDVVHSMITRFVSERDEEAFGIYSGTVERGRVLRLGSS